MKKDTPAVPYKNSIHERLISTQINTAKLCVFVLTVFTFNGQPPQKYSHNQAPFFDLELTRFIVYNIT